MGGPQLGELEAGARRQLARRAVLGRQRRHRLPDRDRLGRRRDAGAAPLRDGQLGWSAVNGRAGEIGRRAGRLRRALAACTGRARRAPAAAEVSWPDAPIRADRSSRCGRATGTRRHPCALQVESHAHLSGLGRVAGAPTTSSTLKIAAYRGAAGHARQRAPIEPAGGAASCRDEIGQLAYKVWYFASLEVRRGSARQRDQRADASRCRFSSRRPRRRAPGSAPSC